MIPLIHERLKPYSRDAQLDILARYRSIVPWFNQYSRRIIFRRPGQHRDLNLTIHIEVVGTILRPEINLK